MKLSVIFLSLIMILSSSVFAKSPGKADGKRKPAESHGGVMRNNIEFKAVTDWAIVEAGSLYRVHAIKKITDCRTLKGETLYAVYFGGQDSSTGIESTDKEPSLVTAELVGEAMSAKVSEYKGKDCKWGNNI